VKSPGAYAPELLSATSLAAYLATRGWALEEEKPGRHRTYVRPPTDGLEPARVMLPINRQLRDYARRLEEAVWGVEEYYRLTRSELTDEIAALRADMLFVRLDQATTDGTIPFKQASKLLESVQRLLRAAATTTVNPESTHTGRRPAQVTDFLDEDLRLGHTRHGSFVVTVVARHAGAEVEDRAADDPSHEPPPFTRRVMTTLAQALGATGEVVTGAEAEYASIEDLTNKGVSLEFVQSLMDVTDSEGLRALDLSFQWATGMAEPQQVPPRILLQRDEFPSLQVLNDRLQRRAQPRTVTLFGRVKSLSREELDDGLEDNAIVLEAEVDGRLRNVLVPLEQADYDWAIEAHRHRLPFTVTGDLVKRRTWRLEGRVDVDLEFIKHHLSPGQSSS
jgi:hypothetical protein